MAKGEGPTAPSVEWDGSTVSVVLPQQTEGSIEARWKPGVTYVVRLREAGSSEWSFGFETPLTHAGVIGLKPNTEYEFSVTAKNDSGESEPAITRVRTNPEGGLENGSC